MSTPDRFLTGMELFMFSFGSFALNDPHNNPSLIRRVIDVALVMRR